MDQISIPSLIFVSFPEGVIVAILGLLSIGKFDYLKSKKNYIRIAIFGIIYALAGYFIRRVATSFIESSLIYLILTCFAFIFIIHIKYYESIVASFFSLFVLLFAIQTLCMIPILSLTGVKLESAYLSDVTRFLLNLPDKILSIVIIYFSMRFKLKIVNFDSSNIKKREYIVQMFVYALSIGTLIFLVAIMANTLMLNNTTEPSSANDILLRINIYISVFVILILTLAIRNITEHYKAKNKISNTEIIQNLEYLSTLIEERNYSAATETIHNIRKHIANQN